MADKHYALLFPGQGSQSVGMLGELAGENPVVRETFDQASAALGYDLWTLCQQGPQEHLNLTERTQPLLLTASVAVWRVLQQREVPSPAFMAGHSLGEFSALVCAGALEFAEAVNLVRQRGRFMQTAVPVGEGAMAAVVGLEDSVVEAICAELTGDQVVEAVNYNAPGQIVIAGHTARIDEAMQNCRDAGARRAVSLPVSAPFHTSLMRPAGVKLAEVLENITVRAPAIPVVHNVTALPETDPARIRTLLGEQIYSPVRWTECIRYIVDEGVDVCGECGPGKVLAGLCKRIDRSLRASALEVPDSLGDFVGSLQSV